MPEKKDMQKKIEARIKAEAERKNQANEENRHKEREKRIIAQNKRQARAIPSVAPNDIGELSDREIENYLAENRVGDAKLYTRLFRNKFLYVVTWDKWLFWTGQHWLEDFFNQRLQAIQHVWNLYGLYSERKRNEAQDEDIKERKAFLYRQAEDALRRVSQLTNISGQNQLEEMCKRIPDPMIAKGEQFDAIPWLKACPNGVIDLRDGHLYQGKPEDFLLKNIPTEYDQSLFEKDDPCPEVNSFLMSSLDNDKEVVDFIWRLLGYGMITKRSDHIFIIFWGEHGRNGKDTLIKLVTHVLGEELSGDVSVDMFLQTGQQRSSAQSSPDILDLRGMCIAWINEAEDNQRFALSKLKKLTGGGFINARGNYDKTITRWEQTHLPIMTTNELPRAKADDAAFWSRALIVKWPFSFVDDPDPNKPHEKKAIKDLDSRLLKERKGVLARMVQGAVQYFREGLQIPQKVKDWTNAQRLNFDDIGQFMEEWCEREPPADNPGDYRKRIKAADLYDAFCLWYAENRDKRYSISSRRFGELLNKKNIPQHRSNGTWRLGLDLTVAAWDAVYNSRQK